MIRTKPTKSEIANEGTVVVTVEAKTTDEWPIGMRPLGTHPSRLKFARPSPKRRTLR
ncbi:hypothetical protein MJ8_56190 [Mesorhizobium sp. J8]|nr:hypothetical protein MJ8_56190 [Mesorhizobium sp. J8]